MSSDKRYRIETIDLLKGLVMVIMALDHVRDYFHYYSFLFDPEDPAHSTLPIFFTRWFTHFCAPAFSFLAGISAFMMGKRKTKNELFAFLVKRGIWLVFIELTVVSFAWFFDIQFRLLFLGVIWSLGISMIVLAVVIYLPRTIILIFSLLLIFGHNLFDSYHFSGNILWALLHDQVFYRLSDNTQLLIGYPLIPWVAVMALGFYFGTLYNQSVTENRRKKAFNTIGISAIGLFVVLRLTNLYGDPLPFTHYGTFPKELMSFIDANKYPPSLLYLLMTLGATFVFLANSEKLKGKLVDFLCTFGRVPFFFYVLHLYVIHLTAMVFAQLSGWGWQKMVFSTWITIEPNMKGYGYSLYVVYAVWIAIVLLLYPVCKSFDKYKQAHKHQWWLSYL